MKQWHFRILVYIVLGLIGLSCAVIGRPEGGDDDKTAPAVLSEGSTPNAQTRFSDRRIELAFDEWVTVSNTTKEIFVSPPLSYPLQVTERGKKVIVEFNEKEELKENTTYQINFGKSIKDLTAGNALEDYTFLFSTGDQIDELSMSGKVIDFESQEGIADIIVLLHDNLSDTAFTTIRPTYLTRTDSDGVFELKNLRADTFQLYALKDENVSYTYDMQEEQIGYLDTMLILSEVLNPLSGLTLELFDEEDTPQFVEARQREGGLIKVVYQPQPKDLKVELLSDSYVSYQELINDTIYFWHTAVDEDSLQLELSYDEVLEVEYVKKAKKSIKELPLDCKATALTIAATDTIRLPWTKPLAQVDTSKLTLSDTSQNYKISAYGTEAKTLWLLSELNSASEYMIKLDSAAVTDWYGQENRDSLRVRLTTTDPSTFGSIKLTLSKSDSISYLLALMKNGEIVEERTVIEAGEILFKNMPAGTYSIDMIQDSNGDGRWTSGNLKEKRKPELKEQVTLEALKAGWDIEATIDITELFYGT